VEKKNGDWKTYLLGVLFTLVMGLTSVAYAGVTQRIGVLDADRKELVVVAQNIALQTAVMNEHLNTLTDAQATTDHKLDQLVSVILEDSKAYKDALKKWEAELNRKK